MNLFLDSGAFSAKYSGNPINLDDYIKFVKDNEGYFDCYANLDVIGDADATWENQQKMEKEGLSPMPVFHLEDGFDWLHHYLDLKYDYICLGGMAKGYTLNQRRSFLDRCWSIICDTPDRMPLCKVHGFGMTSIPLLIRYPWYSVDSTSWVAYGKYGVILVPKITGQNSYDFTKQPLKVKVSLRSPSIREDEQHFDSLSIAAQRDIRRYLASMGFKYGKSTFRIVGKSYEICDNEKKLKLPEPCNDNILRERILPEGETSSVLDFLGQDIGDEFCVVEKIVQRGVCNTNEHRDYINALFFVYLQKNVPKWPWPFYREGAEELGLI